jgi:hypothetical protein
MDWGLVEDEEGCGVDGKRRWRVRKVSRRRSGGRQPLVKMEV